MSRVALRKLLVRKKLCQPRRRAGSIPCLRWQQEQGSGTRQDPVGLCQGAVGLQGEPNSRKSHGQDTAVAARPGGVQEGAQSPGDMGKAISQPFLLDVSGAASGCRAPSTGCSWLGRWGHRERSTNSSCIAPRALGFPALR